MDTQAFEIAQAVLISLGGGGLMVFGLSSFLGKLWAQRILQAETVAHENEINHFKTQLESLAHKNALNYQQKLDIYKVVSSPMVELVALLSKENGLTKEHVQEFDRQRLHITSQLAIFAPQNVFDAFNHMVDYIYDSLESGNFQFHEFRIIALKYMSEMRKDIGIYTDDVSYNGHR